MERKRTRTREEGSIKIEKIDDILETRSIPEEEEVDFLYDKPKTLMGRPGKYHPYMTEEVEKMAKFGLKNEEIAEFYGMHPKTLTKYIHLYPELERALYAGRDLNGQELVASLNKQAVGYEVEEFAEERGVKKNGEEYVKNRKYIRKNIQPNANAAIFLLKTRFPNRFVEKSISENNSTLNVNINRLDLSDMSFEELMVMKKLGLKQLPEG